MLQINTIRENKDEVIKRLAIKNFPAKELIEKVLEIDANRRTTQAELDNLLAEQNTLARQVGDLFKAGKQAEANDLKNKSTALKEESKIQSDRLGEFEKAMVDILVKIPNTPSSKVTARKTPEDNEVVY